VRLLLTGGSGFIGSRLALAARERQLDVVITGQINSDAERSRVEELSRAGITMATGPLQDAEFARHVVAGCDLVIHLAAAQHEANVPDAYFDDVNVGGTRSLLEASRSEGVKRFVHGSTIGVYGSASQGMLDEASPTLPVNVYGRTKLAAEQVVREYAPALETCIVRISETYGPGDFRLLKLFRAIDRGAFMMIGNGQNQRQVMHVNDLIRGLLLATEHPAAVGQTFVMPGHEVMTTRQLVGKVAGALERPVPRLRLPLWPFIAAAAVFETAFKPLGIQPPLHRRRLDFFRKGFVFSTRKAEALLGFIPRISFSEGARETAAWYRAQGLLAGRDGKR
jgi:nucleoside-diphosphate-sugar epimerase